MPANAGLEFRLVGPSFRSANHVLSVMGLTIRLARD